MHPGLNLNQCASVSHSTNVCWKVQMVFLRIFEDIVVLSLS